MFSSSIDKQKIFIVFSVLEKFDEREWQDELCRQAIEMLRDLQDLIASLDGEKYDHRTEDQKRYRLPDQWQHNLYHAKKEREEFYKWLKETEEKIGRKAKVIDRITEHLKIRDKHE